MERVIFIEFLDRRGDVVRRERAAALPVRIGRAYDNDIIIDDPHVCPAHALLEETPDGALRLRDLESLNGLATPPGGTHVNSVTMRPDTVVALGRTLLRVRDSSHPVSDALPISRQPRGVVWALNHWTAGLAWAALLVGASVFQSTREATADINWTSLATAQGGVLLAMLAWAGAWALVTRLLTHHARFVAHLAIGVLAVVAGELEQRVFGFAQFLFAPVEPLQAVHQVATAVIFACAIFAHLTVLGAGRRSRRVLAATGIGVAVLALGLGNEFADEPDWMVTLPYWSRLEPLPATWLPVESPEAFFRESQGMESELQTLREDLPDEGED